MTNHDILRIIREASLTLGHEIDTTVVEDISANNRSYQLSDFLEFKRDLTDSAHKVNLTVYEQTVAKEDLLRFLKESNEVVVLFEDSEDELSAVPISVKGSAVTKLLDGSSEKLSDFSDDSRWLRSPEGVVCLILVPYKSLTGNVGSEPASENLTPVKRLFRLLSTERKEIVYIFVYAIIIGLVSLMLPVGLQTTVELISGGVVFSSVYVLIGLVIIGVLATGVLQIVQLGLVEHLQRRIFTKAAFEFAFRIPKIKMEALSKYYAPELVNRFFDVITIQKGLPKLLIDLSAAAIQILFGIILLSLYHPFFIWFGFILIIILIVILAASGPKGLSSSINESKYKYKVVQWLEEMARALHSFKLMGNTDLPINRTDGTLSNYLKYRKTHFSVLITQFSAFVFFKVAVTAALLIMGTILVINREITLGQFVASEVVIILVLNAVEKMIMYTEVVYDMLTAVEKVSHVTDLPLERSGGFDFPKEIQGKGYSIEIDSLRYAYENSRGPALDDVTLKIERGERVCIAGSGGSGKSTLVNIISGLYTDYQGGVSINGFSLRDLDLTHLRDKVAKNISQEDLFDGTLYENITLGKRTTQVGHALDALQKVGLKVSSEFPQGLQTKLISGGKGLSNSIIHKLILARCLAKNPELLILNDFFAGVSKSVKLELIHCAIEPSNAWTLIAVSNDPMVMAACDRVIVMENGKIVGNDSYENLLQQGVIQKYVD